MADEIVYMNIALRGETSTSIAKTIPAEESISRSGTVIDDASDYYVAVVRLSFTTNNPIIIAPCTSSDFFLDGISTDWSLTVRQTQYGPGPGFVPTEYFGVARIKLLRTDPILGQVSQPTDLYTAVWSPEEWVIMVNNALLEAYNACVTAGATLIPGDEPFVSLIPGTGRLRLSVYPFSDWDQGIRPVPTLGVTINDLLMNWPAQIAFGGFATQAETLPNAPLDPNGCDYRFVIQSDGSNYAPANTVPERIAPTTPATTQLRIEQSFPTQKLPGIVKVAVLSSLPTMQEYIPGNDGKGSRAVLTDFVPDTTNVMTGEAQSTLIYNASIGDARWIKLKGGSSISSFSVRAITEDWLGTVRTIQLSGPYENFSMKLAFAPRRIVDAWKTRE
jgi:hypothetical protein